MYFIKLDIKFRFMKAIKKYINKIDAKELSKHIDTMLKSEANELAKMRRGE